MRFLLFTLFISFLVASCDKEEIVANIKVEGYWQVQDPTYTLNTTRDRFHLFKGTNVYYLYTFLKTDNFANLSLRPQSDSLVSFYKVEGRQLMLPNPSPSATNVVPGNDLLSQSENEMTFTRYVILKRDLTGKILQGRTDTIRYSRVIDAVKVAYFDNYLKKYHP